MVMPFIKVLFPLLPFSYLRLAFQKILHLILLYGFFSGSALQNQVHQKTFYELPIAFQVVLAPEEALLYVYPNDEYQVQNIRRSAN